MSFNYICHNGNFIDGDGVTLSHKNRAFCYGDALFETIHCLGTEPQFFDNHWIRLSAGMKILKMIPDKDFTKETAVHQIGKLLNKNRIFKGARIRLTAYRNEGGLYTPEGNSVSFLIESSPLVEEQYTLNKKGLSVDIFDNVHKPVNILSNLKTANALIYVLAGLYRKENGLDECLILNQYGRVAESISSNIFLVKDEKIVTPPLTEGCIAGTMRQNIIQLATRSGYLTEERALIETQLLDADEVFITNAIQGLQWIGAYKDRRYYNFVSRKLIAALNTYTFRGKSLTD